jgi:hypothetical protein
MWWAVGRTGTQRAYYRVVGLLEILIRSRGVIGQRPISPWIALSSARRQCGEAAPFVSTHATERRRPDHAPKWVELNDPSYPDVAGFAQVMRRLASLVLL